MDQGVFYRPFCIFWSNMKQFSLKLRIFSCFTLGSFFQIHWLSSLVFHNLVPDCVQKCGWTVLDTISDEVRVSDKIVRNRDVVLTVRLSTAKLNYLNSYQATTSLRHNQIHRVSTTLHGANCSHTTSTPSFDEWYSEITFIWEQQSSQFSDLSILLFCAEVQSGCTMTCCIDNVSGWSSGSYNILQESATILGKKVTITGLEVNLNYPSNGLIWFD